MNDFFQNLLTASLQGSVIILTVLILRRVLQKTSKKMICFLWVLAFARLLIPMQIESKFSLQPALFSALPDLSDRKWIIAVGILWLAVTACFAIYSIISYLRMKRIVRESIKIHGGWLCDRIDTAFILGFIDPQIYIPISATAEERHHILEHERTHLDKGDLWLKMLGFVALALHWFNPLVWLAYAMYSKDIEMACDERVVQFMDLKERKQYSMALLNYSSNKAHMAACPIAFGEVSVKERILFILDYKRPGFWISLVTLLSIAFVAGCLMTSPTKFDLQSMTPEEIVAKCIEENRTMQNSENCYLHVDVTYDFDSGGSGSDTIDFRRHGDNFVDLHSELTASTMYFEGRSAQHYGDRWAEFDGDFSGYKNWILEEASPEGKEINYNNGIQILSNTSASIEAAWTDVHNGDQMGTFIYCFNEDGTLNHIEVIYRPKEESGTKYHKIITPVAEKPNVTYTHIKAIAAEVLTRDELNAFRSEQESVTDIPSNKTFYDQNFPYGSEAFGWSFFNGERTLYLSAESVSHIGLTLFWSDVKDGVDYQDRGPLGGSVTGGNMYWLEEFVDGTWEKVSYRNYDPSVLYCDEENVSLDTVLNHRTVLDWSKLYGKLDGGFYRVGRYFSITKPDGSIDTKVCYAKFRLYDEDQEANIQDCKDALAKLLSSDSYHLTHITHYVSFNAYTIHTQIWKNGNNYLRDAQYPYIIEPTKLYARSGLMMRDGNTYELEWSGKTVDTPLSKWSAVDYVDEGHFTMWSAPLFWDAQTENVSRNGNIYTVLIYYGEDKRSPYAEMTFTIDENGLLSSMKWYELPSLGCADSEKILIEEMILHSTAPEDIAAVINKQDLNKPPAFSWAEDSAAHPAGSTGVRTVNFVNTGGKTISDSEDAIAVAIKDCTLPASQGIEPGTNMQVAYYDESANMWKVEFTLSYAPDVYEAVYITDSGETKLAVQLTINWQAESDAKYEELMRYAQPSPFD